MEVTGLASQDRPQWANIWRAYLAFYGTSLSDEVFEHTWRRVLDNTVLHGLAARIDGQIVGITHFLFHGSAWTTAPVCYLQDLYVDGAARGQGAGRALIEAVAAHARERGRGRGLRGAPAPHPAAPPRYDRLAKHSGFIRYEHPLS